MLLNEAARRIESCLSDDDLAARLGGDEFAVLLRRTTDVEAAREVAERVTEALSQPTRVDSIVLECGASVGLAYTNRAADAESLLRNADAALYEAKALGKGRWCEHPHS